MKIEYKFAYMATWTEYVGSKLFKRYVIFKSKEYDNFYRLYNEKKIKQGYINLNNGTYEKAIYDKSFNILKDYMVMVFNCSEEQYKDFDSVHFDINVYDSEYKKIIVEIWEGD